MKIARLSSRLKLYEPTVASDGYGGQSTEYALAGSVWAQLMQANYSEMEALGTSMNREELRFKLRPNTVVQRGWLIKYQGETFRILTVDNTYKDCTTIIVKRYEEGI